MKIKAFYFSMVYINLNELSELFLYNMKMKLTFSEEINIILLACLKKQPQILIKQLFELIK